jgi:hypothetical protein
VRLWEGSAVEELRRRESLNTVSFEAAPAIEFGLSCVPHALSQSRPSHRLLPGELETRAIGAPAPGSNPLGATRDEWTWVGRRSCGASLRIEVHAEVAFFDALAHSHGSRDRWKVVVGTALHMASDVVGDGPLRVEL